MSVLLETSLGELVIDLYIDKCPLASQNFLKLCKVKYYNYNLFHSVQPGFMVQTGTGDPIGSGANSSSIWGLLPSQSPSSKSSKPLESGNTKLFPHELHKSLKHNRRGLVSMVPMPGGGKDELGRALVNGSQFFITFGDQLEYLDGKYTLFGEVAEGFEVLDQIEALYTDDRSRPLRDVRINHTIVLDDPFDDPTGLIVPDRSPDPPREVLESTRLAVDESIDDDDQVGDEAERERMQREREAKAQATTLEILGDLPYADIKPPENVLFVCKLNPVTRSDDLKVIFSRFGRILSCEVIKDKDTDTSLGYAFIEFDEKEACEEAYFKMQNVLIDDRRIHVDFSQSVSKLHNSWMQARQQQIRKEFGGENLYKRQKYRVQEDEAVKEYGYVFDGDRSGRRRRRSRSPSSTSNNNDRHHDLNGSGERKRY